MDEWEKYELHHRKRLAIKPGLTGMWQVSGRSDITDFEEVVELDTKYIAEITFYNLDGEEIEKEPKIIEWDAEAAEKAGFEHFMMKEIHEQPKAVADTLNSVIREGKLDLTEIGLDDERIRSISQVYIVACGSAYHVGMAAQYVIEDLAGLVIGVLTQPELYEKTVSNMVECRSRGAYLMGLTTFGNYNIEDTADFTVYIPKTDPHFATSLAVIPLQLLGYYVSVNKGLDVDKPRNLAKSVTVE